MTPIDNDELKCLIKAIGMKAYVEILFPALIKDKNISVMELCQKYPEFNKYTPDAQNTRRSKARKILENGWEVEALKTISLSTRTDSCVRAKAKDLELKYKK